MSPPGRGSARREALRHPQTRVRLGIRDGEVVCRHPYEPNEPSGYCEWHGWAERKAETHEQRACPRCGLYVVWEPRT